MEESLPPSDDCWDFLYHKVPGRKQEKTFSDVFAALCRFLLSSDCAACRHCRNGSSSSIASTFLASLPFQSPPTVGSLCSVIVSPHQPLKEGPGYDRDLWQGLSFSSLTLEWQGPPPAAGIGHKLSVLFVGWQRRSHL